MEKYRSKGLDWCKKVARRLSGLFNFKKRKVIIMSKRRKVSETPTINYGPATGIPTPEPKNEVLGDSRYTGAVKPGTSKAVSPGHVGGGPGHADCEEE